MIYDAYTITKEHTRRRNANIIVITSQLLKKFNSNISDVPPDLFTSSLNEIFTDELLQASFTQKQIVIIEEIQLTVILEHIHNFFRKKCCNITNFLIVHTHSIGADIWWENYKKLYKIESYKVVDVPCLIGWIHAKIVSPSKFISLDYIKKQQKITKLFSFYGGTHAGEIEKEYMLLKLLSLNDLAIIDYLGRFSEKQHFVNCLEYLTYFKNTNEINKILKQYDQYVTKDLKFKYPLEYSDPKLNYHSGLKPPPSTFLVFNGQQFHIDSQCFFNVVRETIMGNNIITMSEKTIKSMLYCTALVIPNYDFIEKFENLGFFFDKNIINYNYSKEPDFIKRISNLTDELIYIGNNYQINDLNQYYHDNFENYTYNFNYLISDRYFENMKQKLLLALEEFLEN